MLRRKSEFSREERARIVHEFEESNLSGKVSTKTGTCLGFQENNQ
jgi:hypothetical protein